MASSQPSQENSQKIYLRTNVPSSTVSDVPYAQAYGKAPVSYRTDDMVVYSRPGTLDRHQHLPAELEDGIYYTDESTMRSGATSERSNDSKARHVKSGHRSYSRQHHQHHRRPRIEDPDGYWKVPHVLNSTGKLNSTLSGPYVTPGGRQLSKTPKKHTAGVQVLDSEQIVTEKTDPGDSYSGLTQRTDYTQSSQYLHPQIPVSAPCLITAFFAFTYFYL